MRGLVMTAVLASILLVGAAPAAIPEGPINFIKVDELKTLVDQGRKVDLIDVRNWDAYVEMHIKGARAMPLRVIESRAPKEISKTGTVVFYWTCPHALASGASHILYAMGWRNHRVLDEGLPGWHAKGYPVEGTNITSQPKH